MNTSRLSKVFKDNTYAWILITTVFLVALVIAIAVTSQSIDRLRAITEERLRIHAESTLSKINLQYQGSATTLRSMQGFFAGSEEVRRDEFYEFIKTSRFHATYQGFSTVAYIPRVPEKEKAAFLAKARADTSFNKKGYPDFTIHPESASDEYWPILYIEPEDPSSILLGIDQRSDRVRSENISRARDAGDLSVSEVVRLSPKQKPGLIIAAPLYKGKVIPESTEERRALFSGVVSAAFYLEDFFSAVIPVEDFKNIGIGITVVEDQSDNKVFTLSPLEKTSLMSKFYGSIQAKEGLEFGSTHFEFTFEAPINALASQAELIQPFLYIFIYFGAGLFVAFLILAFLKLKKVNELQDRLEFISMLSHQLLTPISVLNWRLEDLKVMPEQEKEKLDLFKAINDLNHIVQKMLVFLKITGKNEVIIKNITSTAVLYEKALKALPSHLDRNRIIKTEINASMKVELDEKKVALAISYIIENAMTYSDQQEKVLVEISANKEKVEIKISDRGYGIPEKERENIFSGFFRATNASLGRNTGSGISLFIAKKVIEANGGEINFTSIENKGTVFTISLPFYL